MLRDNFNISESLGSEITQKYRKSSQKTSPKKSKKNVKKIDYRLADIMFESGTDFLTRSGKKLPKSASQGKGNPHHIFEIKTGQK